MFKHNLLITYRGFLRNKTSFLINLVGLSTGLACALLIYLWVSDELSIDQFHENELYQVLINFQNPHGIDTWELTPVHLAQALKEEFPEVENATLINNRYWTGGDISYGDLSLKSRRLFADEQFFDVLSYELIQGSSEQVLAGKYNIVISEKLAVNLFQSTTSVIGKTVTWSNSYFEEVFQISGIFSSPPSNATEQFDVVLHYDWMIDGDPPSGQWNSGSVETYLILKEGTKVDEFNGKISRFLATKDATWEPATQFIQPYSDRYLYGQYENGVQTGGRIAYVRLFSIIGLIILLIASVNFMNLSTAQASKKMKEVGVKKAIGASRNALIRQFLSESTLMALLSLIAAIGLVVFLLPQFNHITGKPLQLNLGLGPVLSMASIVIFTGLVAGSYPAFYLSGFNVVSVFKGKRNTSNGEQWVRKGLVVFQFALSVIFIVGVLVVNRQMDYVQTKSLGYNRDNVMSFYRPRYDVDPEAFLSALNQIPGVEHASTVAGNMLSGRSTQGGYSWSGQESEKEWVFKSPQIGYDFIETLDMKILAGRSFSREHQDNHLKIILNESALKLMQLDDPIGQQIKYGDEYREIIGVVSDFHYGSLHHKVTPLIFRYPDWGWGTNTLVKIKAGTEKATIEQVANVYKEFHPDDASSFIFTFLDDDYQALYEAEQRVAALSRYFSMLAIIISCLGLFGLAAFTAERRTKEIGIRKILGASVWGIVKLLSSDFTKMVLGGILIAVPISYLVAKYWLDGFAYTFELSWWLFAGAATVTLLIAWIVVGFQTLKAANINPAECLQHK